jgi:hypothetical protein
MTTSLSMHSATNVTTHGVSHDNANAITLTVHTDGHWGSLPHAITIFDLPTHIADALEELLGSGGVKPVLNEADIRADYECIMNKSIDQLWFPRPRVHVEHSI